MKYILIITILALVSLSLNAQSLSIFSKATKSSWYKDFLNPVMESITQKTNNKSILDIGTGTGTLPAMLIKKDSSLQIIGIDIDPKMIKEAQSRLSHKNVSFQIQKMNAPLAFTSELFDVVTFCSVLFLVDDTIKTKLMNEALRVLKPNGQIIILTPSGTKSISSSFIEVWHYPFSVYNFTFPIWKIATTGSARKWQRNKWLENFAHKNQLKYTNELTFNNNATLETISKK